MSLIAEFTVPADEFALYETLSEVPEMTVDIERVVAHEEEQLVPYFWTSGENYTEFETNAANDPSVRELTKALSKRLRGGHGTLIANSLMIQSPDTETDY